MKNKKTKEINKLLDKTKPEIIDLIAQEFVVEISETDSWWMTGWVVFRPDRYHGPALLGPDYRSNSGIRYPGEQGSYSLKPFAKMAARRACRKIVMNELKVKKYSSYRFTMEPIDAK